MLKKEKTRAQDAAAQLANITNSQGDSRVSTMKNEGRMDFISDLGGRAIQHIKRGILSGSIYLFFLLWCLVRLIHILFWCDISHRHVSL